MSSECFIQEEEHVEVVFVTEYESSEDPPMNEWSSLIFEIPETNLKIRQYEEGLYSPGSGEICAKYIKMSDSTVTGHPYYNYPAIKDPGICRALLRPEPRLSFTDDGQELYLAVCKEMGQCPVRMFHRSLLNEVVDLRYYGVNPQGVRAMAMALQYNKFVKVFILLDNFLSDDACFHLGEMLTVNSSLRELNLAGCRIGPEGIKKLLAGLALNRALKEINLNRNELGERGAESIANAVFYGLDIQRAHLNSNEFGVKAANYFTEAFETHNKFITLDLSKNKLYTAGATYNLLTRMGESKVLQELNLSWNALAGGRLGNAIKNLFNTPNLKNLDLSYNRLSGEAIKNIIGGLHKAKKLVTLDLSYNPLTPGDALRILQKLLKPAVKLQKLIMDNVYVNNEFLELLIEVRALKCRKDFCLTYGGIVSGFKGVGADPRELVLNRADFLGKRSKKHHVDIALIIYQLLKEQSTMLNKDFARALKLAGAPLDEDLVNEIASLFAGPRTEKGRTINIQLLAEYLKRKWPERKLPPTPPPEPEPEPIPPSKGKKKKGKGKK